jgi:hypothetical protein
MHALIKDFLDGLFGGSYCRFGPGNQQLCQKGARDCCTFHNVTPKLTGLSRLFHGDDTQQMADCAPKRAALIPGVRALGAVHRLHRKQKRRPCDAMNMPGKKCTPKYVGPCLGLT